ncbi:hypothetical protein O1R50_03425 [Glycomyces luteolus]|uniref:Uncharacterized protein n=1 Tax=Glycomyces luteolus TaxID=2670330 RepID=A0A9X3P4U0_9ACTN|nr:hypothetical protein [Glycomyces luteolus]MDA1358656.1 hypothetical protein [Glycomyces luteolus]
MADVDPDKIDAFADWCANMALVLREYRSNFDGEPMTSGGLAGGDYPAAPVGTIPAVSDGTEFAGELLDLGQVSWSAEAGPPPGVDLGASPGDSGISPWAHAMAQEWNMGVRGRVMDLERAYDELERLADDLKAVAQSWRDADDASASEIAAQNSEIDYNDREW